ncbi:MAG: hypothetical protein EXQ81_02515 [Thermoleophilia bacterium]|nr:hypothetical protein [Thermoleophilia bacterium]
MSGDPALGTLPPETVEDCGPDPAARVLSWRIERLIAVGFESEAAFLLALDRGVDLHDATELVRRGCHPATAFRILL